MIGAMVRCGFPERRTPVRNGFSETLGFVKDCPATAALDILYLKTLS
jgi:hypothetical protein